MSMNYPLGDMLARIRNAQKANLPLCRCPWSGPKEAVVKAFENQGFIKSHKVEDIGNNKKDMIITLKYDEEGNGAIREMRCVSTPGRRVYSGSQDIPKFYGGLGVTIVTTPKGVMSDLEARNQNVGGEVLCQVF